MNVLGIYKTANFSLGDALLISLIAIIIVFLILILLIAISSAISKGMQTVDYKTKINPRPENKLLEEDPDAIVAAITATIDFNKEFGCDARLVSIKKED